MINPNSGILILLLFIGINISAQPLKRGTTYKIESKTSQKVFDINPGFKASGSEIWQNQTNASESQKFVFSGFKAGNDVYYNIHTKDNLLLSLKYTLVTMQSGQSHSMASPYSLIEDTLYKKANTTSPGGSLKISNIRIFKDGN